MQHGTPTTRATGRAIARATSSDPLEDRIAALSAEYIDADPGTRAKLAAEFDALVSGDVIRMGTRR